MKKKILITSGCILGLVLLLSILIINYLNSEDYIEGSKRQQLLEDIPLLDEDFTFIESEGEGKSFFGENTYFYIIEYRSKDYEKQLALFETSDLYQVTDGYLNELVVKTHSYLEYNNSFNEITKCDCYRIIKKMSYTSKYSEYIYLINDHRFAIIIDKN